MSFTVFYNIRAVDHFSKISDKIAVSALKMEASLKRVSKSANFVSGSFNNLDRRSEKLRISTSRLNQKLTENNRQFTRSNIEMGQAVQTTKSLERANRRLAVSEKAANVNRQQSIANLKTYGDGMQKVGGFMLKRVALPMAIAGAAALKTNFDINKGMASVATLIPGNIERVRELKKGIQDLAIETGTATGDLTAGAYAAISAWGDSEDTIARLGVVAKTAKAGLASTEDTLALLSTMTEIYGDNSAEAAERVSDLAFVANKLAIKAPFAEMASSMGSVAPLAKQLRISQEELFATLTAGAGVTGSVSEVSTQMASLYTSMIKETPAMTDVVAAANKELGTSFADSAEAIGSMGTIDFLRQIEKHTEGTKGFTAALGGRKEGLILALSLLHSRTAKYNEAMKEMTTKTGQMKVAYDEVANGINKSGEDWEKLKQRFMISSQTLGEKLIPMFEKTTAVLIPLIDKVASIDEEQMDAIISTGKLALKVGLLFVGIGKVLSIASGVASFFSMATSQATAASKAMESYSNATGAAVANSGNLQGLLARGGLIVGAAGFGIAIGGYITDTLERFDKSQNKKANERLKEADKITFGKQNYQQLLEMKQQILKNAGVSASVGEVVINQQMGIKTGGPKDEKLSFAESQRRQIEANQAFLKLQNKMQMLKEIEKKINSANLNAISGKDAIEQSVNRTDNVFPFGARQKQETQMMTIKMDINAPEGTVEKITSKTPAGTTLDLGDNKRL